MPSWNMSSLETTMSLWKRHNTPNSPRVRDILSHKGLLILSSIPYHLSVGFTLLSIGGELPCRQEQLLNKVATSLTCSTSGTHIIHSSTTSIPCVRAIASDTFSGRLRFCYNACLKHAQSCLLLQQVGQHQGTFGSWSHPIRIFLPTIGRIKAQLKIQLRFLRGILGSINS